MGLSGGGHSRDFWNLSRERCVPHTERGGIMNQAVCGSAPFTSGLPQAVAIGKNEDSVQSDPWGSVALFAFPRPPGPGSSGKAKTKTKNDVL